MCLAIPAEVHHLDGDVAVVDFGGVRRRVGIALVPTVAVGDYVLVHTGFAIQIISVEEAERTLELIREVYSDLAEEQIGGTLNDD